MNEEANRGTISTVRRGKTYREESGQTSAPKSRTNSTDGDKKTRRGVPGKACVNRWIGMGKSMDFYASEFHGRGWLGIRLLVISID